MLGAVALHPTTGHIDLLCDFYPDSYVRSEQAAAFVHRVLAEYPCGPIDLVWDNLNAHKSRFVKELLIDHPRLSVHYLPPYAPDLNAVEGVWCLSETTIEWPITASMTWTNCMPRLTQALKRPGQLDQQLLKSCFPTGRTCGFNNTSGSSKRGRRVGDHLS